MPPADDRSLNVLIFGAALRQGSLNHRLAELAAHTVESRGARVDRATMAEFDCPPYDGDLESEGTIPEPALELCRRLKAADALVISSPEYNASMPGVLKNTIDWTSRVRPQPFNGKQCYLLSASPSMAGGNRGLWALRVPLEHLGARVYPDMFSLAQAHEAFGEDSRLANDLLQKRFDDNIGCFLDLVEAALRYPGLKKQWVEFLGEKPNPATDRTETNDTEAA
ncbi:MAG TPA: NAD(P)H-dependent oxidoreductase [Gemmatimonadaceae bacterium]|nr:NAD(P)H-dependent oxidoreductase [Gemmatimonadaceae bacterium]